MSDFCQGDNIDIIECFSAGWRVDTQESWTRSTVSTGPATLPLRTAST